VEEWKRDEMMSGYQCARNPKWEDVTEDHWCYSFLSKDRKARKGWQICAKCGEEKTLRFFYRRKINGKMQRFRDCKECMRKKHREYVASYDKRKPWSEVDGKPQR